MFTWLFGSSEIEIRMEELRRKAAHEQYVTEIQRKQSESRQVSQGKEVWVKGSGLDNLPSVIYWTKDHKSVLENGRYVSYFLKKGERE